MSEGESRVSNTPHREAPITVALKDYEKLQRERDALRARLDALESADSRARRWAAGVRTLATWTAVTASVGGLCWGFWWLALRGGAEGERARHNAEVEAVRYLTRTRGVAPSGVACIDEPEDGMMRYDMTCTVNPPTMLVKTLHCDSDEPFRNDGCREVPR